MKHASEILEHRAEVLQFLKTRFPLYHQSNVFFRDIQYGMELFLERKGIKISYPAAEGIAREFVSALERDGILSAVDRQSWALNYPEFRTPQSKPAPPARPAGPVPGARPAAPATAPAKPVAAKPPASPPAEGQQEEPRS